MQIVFHPYKYIFCTKYLKCTISMPPLNEDVNKTRTDLDFRLGPTTVKSLSSELL